MAVKRAAGVQNPAVAAGVLLNLTGNCLHSLYEHLRIRGCCGA
jgi:hypothetical protein